MRSRNKQLGLIGKWIVGTLAFMLLFASTIQPVSAFQDTQELRELTFEFSGHSPLSPYVVLNLFEKKSDGRKTKTGIPGAKFQLHKEGTDESVGGLRETDINGQIVTEELEVGSYYFKQTLPANSWDFDTNGDDAITQYAFSITEEDLEKIVIVVTAYNIPSTSVNPGTPDAPNTSLLPVTGYKGTTYVVGEDGYVTSWGDNSADQLGREGSGSTAKRMTFPNGDKIAQVVTGRDGGKTMYAITLDGFVYSWGTGVDGSLGTGGTIETDIEADTEVRQPLPMRVQKESGGDLDKVVSLSLGYGNGKTMFAMTSDNRVYAWGFEDGTGMLGTGDDKSISEAKLVMNEAAATLSGVHHIVAGYGTDTTQTMLAVSDTGEVYAWGENGDNQLAVGDTMNNVWRNRKAIALSSTTDYGTWKGDDTAWTLDVDVPIGSLAFYADANGNLTLPSDPAIEIINHTTQPIKLANVKYEEGTWRLVDTAPDTSIINNTEFQVGTDFDGDHDLLTVLKEKLPNQVLWSERWATQGTPSIEFALKSTSQVAPQTKNEENVSAGDIAFVLDWF